MSSAACDKGKVWPPIVIVVGKGIKDKDTVDVPTTKPFAPSEIGIPAIVTAGAFGVTAMPATMTLPSGSRVTDFPAAVMTGAVANEDMGIVEVPTIRPSVPREIDVPATVIAGAFGAKVVPAMTTLPLGSTAIGWLAEVMIGAETNVGRGIVEDPTTRALLPTDIGVPATVMAGAFGVSMVPAIAKPFGRAVTAWPAAVIIGGGLGDSGEGAGLGTMFWIVEVPRTRSPFECTATVVPATTIGAPPRVIDCPSTTTTRGEDAACMVCPWIVVENGTMAAGSSLTVGEVGELPTAGICGSPPATTSEAAGSTIPC